jgi:hypothetical protein
MQTLFGKPIYGTGTPATFGEIPSSSPGVWLFAPSVVARNLTRRQRRRIARANKPGAFTLPKRKAVA